MIKYNESFVSYSPGVIKIFGNNFRKNFFWEMKGVEINYIKEQKTIFAFLKLESIIGNFTLNSSCPVNSFFNQQNLIGNLNLFLEIWLKSLQIYSPFLKFNDKNLNQIFLHGNFSKNISKYVLKLFSSIFGYITKKLLFQIKKTNGKKFILLMPEDKKIIKRDNYSKFLNEKFKKRRILSISNNKLNFKILPQKNQNNKKRKYFSKFLEGKIQNQIEGFIFLLFIFKFKYDLKKYNFKKRKEEKLNMINSLLKN